MLLPEDGPPIPKWLFSIKEFELTELFRWAAVFLACIVAEEWSMVCLV